MVTEVDHHAIKTRIKDILKADPLLYDSTGEPNKLVDIFVGRPYADNISAHTTPFCFIANEDNLEEQEPDGVVENNTSKSTRHDCHYFLCIVDDAQDGREVEKLLDNLGKLTMQTLKANFELRKPVGLTDPKCDWSFPERVSVFNASDNGKPIQGRSIHFHVITHTN
tara:strand:+ start:666 stop:1166 length:501 start_codon:yes stop_codon:yes gene_type:complete